MREFVINEISGVDVPAQAHARVALMKRADREERQMQLREVDGEQIAEFDSFDEAVAHLEKIVGRGTAAMSEAARRYPELLRRYRERRADAAKADSGPAPAIRKAEQDFALAVDEIAKRDGCPRSEAMTRARVERPELFARYQVA
jgi:hypothetical protein